MREGHTELMETPRISIGSGPRELARNIVSSVGERGHLDSFQCCSGGLFSLAHAESPNPKIYVGKQVWVRP